MNNKIQNKHLVFTGKMEHGDRKDLPNTTIRNRWNIGGEWVGYKAK